MARVVLRDTSWRQHLLLDSPRPRYTASSLKLPCLSWRRHSPQCPYVKLPCLAVTERTNNTRSRTSLVCASSISEGNSAVENADGRSSLGEDDKFVELEPQMSVAFGPPALLVLGLSEEERAGLKEALVFNGADFVVVAPVTSQMMATMSLFDAFQAATSASVASDEAFTSPNFFPSSTLTQGASVAVCLMSGLTGEECLLMVEIVEEQLPSLAKANRLAFAAMLPKFADKPLHQVIEDILGDHASVAAPS